MVPSSLADSDAGYLQTKFWETLIFENLIFAGHCTVSHLYTLSDSIFLMVLWERVFYYPHFTDEQIEAWKR